MRKFRVAVLLNEVKDAGNPGRRKLQAQKKPVLTGDVSN